MQYEKHPIQDRQKIAINIHNSSYKSQKGVTHDTTHMQQCQERNGTHQGRPMMHML